MNVRCPHLLGCSHLCFGAAMNLNLYTYPFPGDIAQSEFLCCSLTRVQETSALCETRATRHQRVSTTYPRSQANRLRPFSVADHLLRQGVCIQTSLPAPAVQVGCRKDSNKWLVTNRLDSNKSQYSTVLYSTLFFQRSDIHTRMDLSHSRRK